MAKAEKWTYVTYTSNGSTMKATFKGHLTDEEAIKRTIEWSPKARDISIVRATKVPAGYVA